MNSEDEVIMVANDTDVLILLVYAYAMHRLSRQWKTKVDTNRYIDIKTIGEHYGRDVCLVLAAYYSITGCDTTSFPYKVGKIKPFFNYGKKTCIHIKRAALQCYVWKKCYQQIISDVSQVGRGWKIVGKLLNPVWFDGFQLPPILRKSID